MPAVIKVVNMYTKVAGSAGAIVNTTNNSTKSWESDLSPFVIGPCDLYGPYAAQNVENAWQYSKLYACHADTKGEPTPDYWTWAKAGFLNPKANRFPMGRGKKPLHAWWDGRKLGYIDARKEIYGPVFAEAVQKTAGWEKLVKLYNTEPLLTLRDYDGYDYASMGVTLTDVLNNPKKKMGHAFVLAMLLLKDPALKQMKLRS